MSSFDEIVGEGVELCLRTKKVPADAVTEEILDGLSRVEMREAARRGWVFSVGCALHSVRTNGGAQPEPGSAKKGTHPATGRNPRGKWAALGRVAMQAHDGTLKRLSEFNAEDARHLAELASAKAAGWSKRAAWATRAAELLEKKGGTVGELPNRIKTELDELAERTWR